MRVSIDLELPGLGEAFGELLPAGTRPTGVHLDAKRLRIEGLAPLGVEVALTARVSVERGRITCRGFDFEGPRFVHGFALEVLARKLAKLDRRSHGFRIQGSQDGEELVVTWK